MIERFSVHPRTPEWFALRAVDLTMSEVGAVIGVDPFSTAVDVWARKCGLVEPAEDNEAMKLGRWCEPAVAAALQERFPDLVIDYPLDLYLRDPQARLGGTPDATARDRTRPDELIAFEFKVISRDSYERWWAEGAPLRYQLQTLGNAMLLGADRGILAALVLGWQKAELVTIEVARHPAAEARIREVAAKFWAAMDEGHAPQPDYERDGATLKALFPPRPEAPAPIDLSGDNRLYGLLDQREGLKATIREAEKECSTIDAELVHKLGGAERACLPGWKISHLMTHRDARMVEAKDYPVLRISKTKEAVA